MLSLYLYATEFVMKKETAHRTGRSAGKVIRGVLLLSFSAGLLLGLYKCFHIVNMNRTAQEAYTQLSAVIPHMTVADTPEKEPAENNSLDISDDGCSHSGKKRRRSIDFAELQKNYPEIEAWIRAAEIGIDYPVMQTDNNAFYLTHLHDGSLNANGAIFIDCNNADAFRDRNTVIYGHNMRSGAMFHSLNEYQAQDFYDACPTMMLYTPEGDYLVELICGTIEDGNYSFVKFNFDNTEEFLMYVNQLRARSTFRSEAEVQPGDRLISMCTCNYGRQTNGRYMLIGRLVELYEA